MAVLINAVSINAVLIDPDSGYIRVIGCGLVPPLVRCGIPIGVRMDAINGTGVKTLITARAQLRDNDDVYLVVEDGSKLLWASPNTGITVDAGVHIDLERWVFPLVFAGTRLKTALSTGLGNRCRLGRVRPLLGHASHVTG